MSGQDDDAGLEPVEKNEIRLGLAVEAARAGDVERAAASLMGSRFPDGLVRRVENQWQPWLSYEDARDIVAESIEALYGKARDGEVIVNVEAWLVRATWFRASTAKREKIGLKEDSLDARENDYRQIATDPKYAERVVRQEGFSLLRSAVAQIQGYNIRRVLEYVFEAVEGGMFPIPASDVAEALGIEESHVRQCLHRGFKRLRDVLIADGWSEEDFDFSGDEVDGRFGCLGSVAIVTSGEQEGQDNE